MKITLEVAYQTGQIVYLITDPEQSEFIVVGYDVDVDSSVKYKIRSATLESLHSAIELSSEQDQRKRFGITGNNH